MMPIKDAEAPLPPFSFLPSPFTFPTSFLHILYRSIISVPLSIRHRLTSPFILTSVIHLPAESRPLRQERGDVACEGSRNRISELRAVFRRVKFVQ